MLLITCGDLQENLLPRLLEMSARRLTTPARPSCAAAWLVFLEASSAKHARHDARYQRSVSPSVAVELSHARGESCSAAVRPAAVRCAEERSAYSPAEISLEPR